MAHSRQTLIVVLGLVLAFACCFDAAPSPAKEATSKKTDKVSLPGGSFDITSDDLNDENNNMLLYDPVEPKQIGYGTTNSRESQPTNEFKPSSFVVTERETTSHGLVPKRNPNLMVAESQGDDAERSGSPNMEKMKDIALNSREVRLVGPNQREVEMKDDIPTKVAVALENLQKEAKEVYGQVNEKLDKGWTELKNSEVWSQMNEKLDKGWTEVKKAEVWGQINEKLDKSWTDLKGMVEGIVNQTPANKSG